MYLTVSSSFLISFVMGGSGPTRVIKFLYSPVPPPLALWALKPEFFGPQMALAYRLDAISQCPKKGAQLPPTFVVMDMYASKTLCIRLYKS
jgi:hypothetical protein